MIEDEWLEEPRSLTEILEVENELMEKIWYNRHQYRAELIANGKITLIEREKFNIHNSNGTIVRDIWVGALKAAKSVEKKYGVKNLGPYDDFQWGMLNGKLSALRWVIGGEWDNLDT